MEHLLLTTLNELDKLEKQYSKKNNRPSRRLSTLIGSREFMGFRKEAIFCYYAIKKEDIVFYILTNGRLIFSEYRDKNLTEISLEDLLAVNIHHFLHGLVLRLQDQQGYRSINIFTETNDEAFLQSICSIIQNAKINYNDHLKASRIKTNPSEFRSRYSVAEQLEKLADLHKSGALTEDEFKRAKERVISKGS